MSPQEIKDLYRRFQFELWNGDLSGVDKVVGRDFVVHQARIDGVPSEEARGPRALATMIEEGRSFIGDLKVTIDVGPLVEGNKVAARWTVRGKYQGGLAGATAPVGKEVDFSGLDILRVEDGKFAEYWVSSDGINLMAQLGVSTQSVREDREDSTIDEKMERFKDDLDSEVSRLGRKWAPKYEDERGPVQGKIRYFDDEGQQVDSINDVHDDSSRE